MAADMAHQRDQFVGDAEDFDQVACAAVHGGSIWDF
jgi:hypothetical protein